MFLDSALIDKIDFFGLVANKNKPIHLPNEKKIFLIKTI